MKTIAGLLAATITVISGTAVYADNNDWDIDSKHSGASFTVKHMMVSNVPGHMGGVVGKIYYDGKNVDTLKVNCTLDPSSINTGEPDRDKHLKGSDFFDVDKFPTITFVSTGVVPITQGGFKLSGKLTIHGISKEVELNVDGPIEPIKDKKRGIELVGATATTTINRKEFGVNFNKTLDNGGAIVGDEVKITLDIEAKRKFGDSISSK